MLMQMLKDTSARSLKSALSQDFSRVSDRAALEICQRADLAPKARPGLIAHRESEALFKAINETRIMAPSTDCIGPIGPDAMQEGISRVVKADFYASCSRSPSV